ncbi:RING zinc finger protein [Tripterygium wilfordii]|uniref:RING-type E3 ubiquitin transferase n=1 Tax=Tripterygium wilfordii TaxID=458696 RepID=A0A7J7DZI7_TRIWF|nr:RING-H2 finger protein ATL78-like [Tripterygium wilfordii]KAF5751812.1 RING zinc finger protein [Tripterygium wilfordii]
MYSSTSTSTQIFQGFLGEFYSRRLLLQSPIYQSPIAAAPPSPGNNHDPSEEPYTSGNTFDANVVMVLSVLLCALICSLGINSIIRCALRCSNLVSSEPGIIPSARLANTGVKRKALKTFPTVIYSTELKLPGLDSECVICLSEFTPGDRVRLLPKCNHGFHVCCIDKWLSSHSSCPTCRHCLIETCQKIVSCSQASSSEPPSLVQESIITIAPLEPEGLMHNYRVIS